MVLAGDRWPPESVCTAKPRHGGTRESTHTSRRSDVGPGQRVGCPRMIDRPRHLPSCAPPRASQSGATLAHAGHRLCVYDHGALGSCRSNSSRYFVRLAINGRV